MGKVGRKVYSVYEPSGSSGQSFSWFQQHEATRSISTPPPPLLDGMLVHRRLTPNITSAGTHLYTWVERGTVRVLPKYTTKPRLLAPESSAVTMRIRSLFPVQCSSQVSYTVRRNFLSHNTRKLNSKTLKLNEISLFCEAGSEHSSCMSRDRVRSHVLYRLACNSPKVF